MPFYSILHLEHICCEQNCSNSKCVIWYKLNFIFSLKPRLQKIIRNCKTYIINKQRPCTQIMALLPRKVHFISPLPNYRNWFCWPIRNKIISIEKLFHDLKLRKCIRLFHHESHHLELCSDLSSAAFARFIGRLWLSQRVVTDIGRNFLGASRILVRDFTEFVKKLFANDIAQKFITHGFERKFIPPHAPNMGGHGRKKS